MKKLNTTADGQRKADKLLANAALLGYKENIRNCMSYLTWSLITKMKKGINAVKDVSF